MDSVLVTLSMKMMKMMIRNVVSIVPAAAETKSKRIYISLLLVLVKVAVLLSLLLPLNSRALSKAL